MKDIKIVNAEDGELIATSTQELIDNLKTSHERGERIANTFKYLVNHVDEYEDPENSVFYNVEAKKDEWVVLQPAMSLGMCITRDKIGSPPGDSERFETAWDTIAWVNEHKKEDSTNNAKVVSHSLTNFLKLYEYGGAKWPIVEELQRQSDAYAWVDELVCIGVFFGALWEKEVPADR